MKRITLAVFTVFALFAADAEAAALADICEFTCSSSTDPSDQACCAQGLDACSGEFAECIEDRLVASGAVCAEIDDLQAEERRAFRFGTPEEAVQAANGVLCCSSGYFPGTAGFDCCLAHADGGKREILRECPKGPALPPPAIVPVCGNKVLEAGESCDDGNEDETDGCLSDCRTPGSVCSPLFSDSSADFNCCVDHVNAGLPAEGCAAPEEPQTLPTTPIEEPTPPSAPPVVEAPAAETGEEGVFTCEVAREEDVGPDGKIIAVSPNGLVPFVIRYRHPSATAAIDVVLRQIEGLPVAITDIAAGSESISGKSLVSALGSGGEAEWVVYLSRPASLTGDWDPDAAFEATVKDGLNAETLATLETTCLASAHVQGGQGGCALSGQGSAGGKASEAGLVSLAVVALILFRSRKSASF